MPPRAPKQTQKQEAPVQEVAPPAPVPAPEVEKTTRRKKAPVAEPVPEPVVEAAPAAPEEPESKDETVRRREVPTRETVNTHLSALVTYLEHEVESSRGKKDNQAATKSLRGALSRVKELQRLTTRVLRQKPPTNRKNANSGFLKPVPISKEIAKFTGFDPATMHSRVDITKSICNYVKEHDLGKGRNIVPDKHLCDLLKYNPTKDDPLTYPRLQTFLKQHFPKQTA